MPRWRVTPVIRTSSLSLALVRGGVMAYNLGLYQPERFAALVALSTWLPTSRFWSVLPIWRRPSSSHHGPAWLT